jgi:hypothetical protein
MGNVQVSGFKYVTMILPTAVADVGKKFHLRNVWESVITHSQSQSQSYITTDGQSANLSWCQAPIWAPRPIFFPSLFNYF